MLTKDLPLWTGVIEGFFGKPWPWEARLETPEFLASLGFEFYIYAPKADTYLRRRWQEAFPEDLEHRLRALCKRCRANRIALGVGLSPFELYRNYDAASKALLKHKLAQINAIDPDILCILFDDMRGDLPDLTRLQISIVEDICSWSSARKFILAPTYYTYDPILVREFGVGPHDYLRDLGRSLDPKVEVFWTGEKVISSRYPAAHLNEVTERLRRRPILWDNHVSNDTKIRCNKLFLNPATPDWELRPDQVAGLAINPMNQAHLSRLTLTAYARLLRRPDGAGSAANEAIAALGDIQLRQLLAEDRATLEGERLDQMPPALKATLLARYDSCPRRPEAYEVAAWLRGEYAFDPQCLTT
ncbi:MAG TPA: beta-N-acetylglucosaminidase domain-containing protein [Steroidobacteraceae bacterium]